MRCHVGVKLATTSGVGARTMSTYATTACAVATTCRASVAAVAAAAGGAEKMQESREKKKEEGTAAGPAVEEAVKTDQPCGDAVDELMKQVRIRDAVHGREDGEQDEEKGGDVSESIFLRGISVSGRMAWSVFPR